MDVGLDIERAQKADDGHPARRASRWVSVAPPPPQPSATGGTGGPSAPTPRLGTPSLRTDLDAFDAFGHTRSVYAHEPVVDVRYSYGEHPDRASEPTIPTIGETVRGELSLNARGLPMAASAFVGEEEIMHDALYRVAQVYYEYRLDDGYGTDTGTDWRGDAAASNADEPGDRTPRAGARSATSTGRTREPDPAPRIGALPANRIVELDYEWDYLGNQIAWLDDAWDDEDRPLGQSFYERGIGNITNGNTEGASETALRPSALYLATNIPTTGVEEGWEGAGWTEVRYGASGNVSSFTVHGHCTDGETTTCADVVDDIEGRIDSLHENCVCADAQHYRFMYDELNRLTDGSRWDWDGEEWAGAARMRYRYDSANQRTVKQVLSGEDLDEPQRVALYVYPGDYERRGVVRGATSYDAVTTGTDATETQYLVAGARIVWDADVSTGTFVVDRNRRATISAGDLLGTTAASLDLETGELLEVSTYYPNGARENLWAHEDEGIPLEPSGFTGKEADEEIGVVYFGERWLIPRLGRWSTPDPLHVHASGGGEALNSYHYVSGNLLQATDPLGLQDARAPSLQAGYRAFMGGRSPDQIYAWGRSWATPDRLVALRDRMLGFYKEALVRRDREGERDALGDRLADDDGALSSAGRRELQQLGARLNRAIRMYADPGTQFSHLTRWYWMRASGYDERMDQAAALWGQAHTGRLTTAGPPAGMSRESWARAQAIIGRLAQEIGGQPVAQGSRVSGAHGAASDIDFAVVVSPERFREIVEARLGGHAPGTSAHDTYLLALERGRILGGGGRGGRSVRAARAELQAATGLDVDVSVVMEGGLFDRGAMPAAPDQAPRERSQQSTTPSTSRPPETEEPE